MKLGIMQPYFLPYIGYFQLISATDSFVIYDNIKYTKQSWINRNRILINGKYEYITLPLRNDSDHLYISQRYLSNSFSRDKQKLLRKVNNNYQNAPFFLNVYELLNEILEFRDNNLFRFIFNSLILVCKYLEINSNFIVSSTLPIDHTLKAENKVLAICKQIQADCYINPIGGIKLYSKERFSDNNIDLFFLNPKPVNYLQNNTEFVPNLSILDVMMFNSKDRIKFLLKNEYTVT